MAEPTVNRFFIFQPSIRLATKSNRSYNPQPMQANNQILNNRSKDRPALLILCLVFSTILHIIIVSALHYQQKKSVEQFSLQNKPTIVRLVDRPKEPHKAIYEIDQKPDNPSAKAPETARVAEANQRVEREMAPKGQDTRDQKAQRPSKPSSFKQPMAAKKSIPSIKPRKKPLISREKNTINKLPEQPPLPPIQKLTQLTPNTLDRIEASEKVERKKIKERADLESGDTVWLNLKRGLLISFFRRFRNQIEGVWNYPVEAIEKEQQGTLLLKITVDRDGGLVDVDLLNSSGSDILDYEAIQAVYRAAPFGPLGKHYPHPDLKIMANFHYHLTGKFIYGKTR